MYAAIKKIFLICVPLLLFSCIREGAQECGIYLEFIFDHNMEYADSFDPQVGTVDVYVFDLQGKYLFSRHADCASELVDRKRMYLRDGLKMGDYHLITVGGLCDDFMFTDLAGSQPKPGITTIEQVRLALCRETAEVSHEFPHLWYGESVQVNYGTKISTWRVPLVRNTNNFNLVLQTTGETRASETAYSLCITTPEGAAYGYDNKPVIRETVTYRPHYLAPGGVSGGLYEARLNTMRLLADDPEGYRLSVYDSRTNAEVWGYDLMDLLRKTKPNNRPDGTSLSLQEYLDRQGEWNIVVIHTGGSGAGDEGFTAMRIEINGWIVWKRDVGV